jgi:hypothetical protein
LNDQRIIEEMWLGVKFLESDSTRKLLDTWRKVAGYKTDTQKSLVFLYTDSEHAEKEIRKTISFTILSKIKIKQRTNLTKEIKDLYKKIILTIYYFFELLEKVWVNWLKSQNFYRKKRTITHWRKKLKKSLEDEKVPHVHVPAKLILWKWFQSQFNTHQISKDIQHRNRKT